MSTNLKLAKQRILNKWDWKNPDASCPVILWGAPGIGKTSLVYSLVAERMRSELENKFIKDVENLDKDSKEYAEILTEFEKKIKILDFNNVNSEFLELISPHCLVLRLAERPIEQLQGVIVPSLSEEKNYARFVMPENLMKVNDSDWGIIFLDELDKASDAKFGAATHIMENRIVGDMQLGKGWYVIAAANREEDSHLSNPIPPELRNRCANIEIEYDLNVWIDWAVKHNVRKDIIMFHKATGGEWLAKFDLETYSFPTPRSWAMASMVIDRLYDTIRPDENNRNQMEEFNSIVRNELIDFVGTRAQAEFYSYRELFLKFDIKSILDGSKRVARLENDVFDSSIISDQCIAAFAMADQVTPDMLGKKEDTKFVYDKKAVGNLVRFISDLSPEVRSIYLQAIHKTRILNLIVDSNMAEDILEEIIEYIAA